MNQKNAKYWHGTITAIPENKIYIQVKHLEKGSYEVNIIHENKIILTTYFEINDVKVKGGK